ncbi:hypothetical protein GQ457_03G037340 [Hibiscus cannabinus]
MTQKTKQNIYTHKRIDLGRRDQILVGIHQTLVGASDIAWETHRMGFEYEGLVVHPFDPILCSVEPMMLEQKQALLGVFPSSLPRPQHQNCRHHVTLTVYANSATTTIIKKEKENEQANKNSFLIARTTPILNCALYTLPVPPAPIQIESGFPAPLFDTVVSFDFLLVFALRERAYRINRAKESTSPDKEALIVIVTLWFVLRVFVSTSTDVFLHGFKPSNLPHRFLLLLNANREASERVHCREPLRRYREVNLPNSFGISPTSWLEERSSTASRFSMPKSPDSDKLQSPGPETLKAGCYGVELEPGLYSSASSLGWDLFPRDEGIGPERWFLCKAKASKFLRFPISGGTEPWKRLLDKASSTRLTRRPISEGIIPLKLLLCSSRNSSLFQSENSRGSSSPLIKLLPT